MTIAIAPFPHTLLGLRHGDCTATCCCSTTPTLRSLRSAPSSQVWIHGGGYNSGSSNTYTPDTLVRQSGDSVVVVTLNYRLNVKPSAYPPTLLPAYSSSANPVSILVQGDVETFTLHSLNWPSLSAHTVYTLHPLIFKLPPSPSLPPSL